MGYIFLFILILVLAWPLWRRWFYSFIQRRAEDTLRKMMGMPSRKEEARRKKAEESRQKRQRASSSASYGRRSSASYYGNSDSSHIIPPEYAEDVEFSEVREFRQTEINGTESGRRHKSDRNSTVVESQVEDVEFIEIKRK